MTIKRSLCLVLSCLLLCAALGGCGLKDMPPVPTVTPEATVAPSAEPVAEPTPEPTAEPTPEPVPDVTLPDGTTVPGNSSSVDFSALSDAEVPAAVSCLGELPSLQLIELGQERPGLSWDSIKQLSDASGEADINYSFTLYDKQFYLADTRMDLNHIPVEDGGALVCQAAECMKNLRQLDMDSCGVSNEEMEVIRDQLPQVKVIWRIWFGDSYSVRTDVKMILASKPSIGGTLYTGNCEPIKYCKDLRYIDLGHNTLISEIGFLSDMPKLEVAILAKNELTDISPLASCPMLEYLEIQGTWVSDLSPLSGLKNLKHLNFCSCPYINDISPLYGLTQMERLWVGGSMCNVPPEQVEEMQKCVPDCLINTTAAETEGQWRYAEVGSLYPLHPRYIQLIEQFNGYDEDAYSFYWNDPLYEAKGE